MNDNNSILKNPSINQSLAFKIIAILLGVICAETLSLAWLLIRDNTRIVPKSFIVQHSNNVNLVQKAYPKVDFTKVYPKLTPADIDQLQRESYSVRYVYTPFVQFKPVPQQKRFVTITANGYRKGWRDQPWPPEDNDFVVFAFGGSTTFSFNLPDDKTVPVMIEKALTQVLPNEQVQCYNFGRGYYICTQEKALFETLLLQGIVPDVAIFLDGLNDYFYPSGEPELTDRLYQFTAPDIPRQKAPKISDINEAAKAVSNILSRYSHNAKMITALAKAYKVTPILIGQPVPFLDFKKNKKTYPFIHPFAGHDLCQGGYIAFKNAALSGMFGNHFIWCGDAFANTDSLMYNDGLHYSEQGAKILAHMIVRKAIENHLIPATSAMSK